MPRSRALALLALLLPHESAPLVAIFPSHGGAALRRPAAMLAGRGRREAVTRQPGRLGPRHISNARGGAPPPGWAAAASFLLQSYCRLPT